jgi:hypothetical protein
LDGGTLGAGAFGDPKLAKSGRSESGSLVHLLKGDHTISADVPSDKTLYLDYFKLEPSKKEKGAIEAETLVARADTGGKEIVTAAPANTMFSGYSALQWNPKTAASYLKLPITADNAGDFTLELGVARLPNSSRIAAQLDGGDIQAAVDTSDKGKDGRKSIRIADLQHLTAGAHLLTLYYKGDDPAVSSPTLVLDYIRLMRYKYPFSIEAEALKVLNHKDGDAQTQDMAGFGPNWSGNSQFWFTGKKEGAEATLELPVQATGRYNLAVYYTTAHDYGTSQVLIDGKPLGDPTDCYSDGVRAKGKTTLGAVDLTAGDHKITFRAVGKNAKSSSYLIGVDAIGLEPVK